jgi:hypothetical protein
MANDLELLILDSVINELRVVTDHLNDSITYFEQAATLPAGEQERLNDQYREIWKYIDRLNERLRPKEIQAQRPQFGFQVPSS